MAQKHRLSRVPSVTVTDRISGSDPHQQHLSLRLFVPNMVTGHMDVRRTWVVETRREHVYEPIGVLYESWDFKGPRGSDTSYIFHTHGPATEYRCSAYRLDRWKAVAECERQFEEMQGRIERGEIEDPTIAWHRKVELGTKKKAPGSARAGGGHLNR